MVKSFLSSLSVSNSPADSRSNIPIALTAEARKVVNQIKSETGMAKQESVARLIEWFAQQTSDVRKAILYGHDAAAELVRLKMAEMAATGEMSATIDQAVATARMAVDRLEHLAKQYQREAADEPPAKPAGKKR